MWTVARMCVDPDLEGPELQNEIGKSVDIMTSYTSVCQRDSSPPWMLSTWEIIARWPTRVERTTGLGWGGAGRVNFCSRGSRVEVQEGASRRASLS